MRLIDADAYAAKMKDGQSACREWVEEAKAEGDEAQTERARQAYVTFTEAKLTLDAMPTIDAIPVDYIKWRIANADREGFKDAAGAFRFVLWGWEETKDM